MLYLCWCKFDLMMYIVPVYIELILVNMYDTGEKWTAIQRTFVNFPHFKNYLFSTFIKFKLTQSLFFNKMIRWLKIVTS